MTEIERRAIDVLNGFTDISIGEAMIIIRELLVLLQERKHFG